MSVQESPRMVMVLTPMPMMFPPQNFNSSFLNEAGANADSSEDTAPTQDTNLSSKIYSAVAIFNQVISTYFIREIPS